MSEKLRDTDGNKDDVGNHVGAQFSGGKGRKMITNLRSGWSRSEFQAIQSCIKRLSPKQANTKHVRFMCGVSG